MLNAKCSKWSVSNFYGTRLTTHCLISLTLWFLSPLFSLTFNLHLSSISPFAIIVWYLKLFAVYAYSWRGTMSPQTHACACISALLIFNLFIDFSSFFLSFFFFSFLFFFSLSFLFPFFTLRLSSFLSCSFSLLLNSFSSEYAHSNPV